MTDDRGWWGSAVRTSGKSDCGMLPRCPPIRRPCAKRCRLASTIQEKNGSIPWKFLRRCCHASLSHRLHAAACFEAVCLFMGSGSGEFSMDRKLFGKRNDFPLHGEKLLIPKPGRVGWGEWETVSKINIHNQPHPYHSWTLLPKRTILNPSKLPCFWRT